MIDQGYVPATCSLHEDLAALLILSEISEGRDPCAGCNMSRDVCKGRPPADAAQRAFHSRERVEKWTLEKKLQDAIDSDPTFSRQGIWSMWDQSATNYEGMREREEQERQRQKKLDEESETISGKLYDPWEKLP